MTIRRLRDDVLPRLGTRDVETAVRNRSRTRRVARRIFHEVGGDDVGTLPDEPGDLGGSLPTGCAGDDHDLACDPTRAHDQIGAAVRCTDSIVSPTKSASRASSISHVPSWREISQIRLQRSKRRVMKRSSAPSRSSDDPTSSASTTASSIAIAAPWPTWGEVAWAASPTSTTRPRYHGGGTSREYTGR